MIENLNNHTEKTPQEIDERQWLDGVGEFDATKGKYNVIIETAKKWSIQNFVQKVCGNHCNLN